MTGNTAIPSPQATGAKILPIEDGGLDSTHLPRTTGEKWFHALKFATGEGVILAATAAIAYVSRYGKDSYGKVPNYLKQFEQWFSKKLLSNPALPLGNSEFGTRLAGAIVGTTVLMHGGNLFAPVMKWLEDKKSSFVDHFNKRWGKPGELEAGQERLRHEAKENWGDIIKGRLASWAIVFTSFFAVDALVGKDKGGMYRFDKVSEGFGRWVAGLTKAGKDIGKTPLNQALSATQDANRTYRFGKIMALDVYATTASLLLWTAISRSSAILRGKKERAERTHPAAQAGVPAPTQTQPGEQAGNDDGRGDGKFTGRMGSRPANYQATAQRDVATSMAMS